MVCLFRFRKAQGSVQRLHNTGGSLPRTRIAELLACSLVSYYLMDYLTLYEGVYIYMLVTPVSQSITPVSHFNYACISVFICNEQHSLEREREKERERERELTAQCIDSLTPY